MRPRSSEQRSAYLADREQQSDQAKRPGPWDPGDGQADRKQDGLDRCGADHAVGDAAYRAGGNVERVLGDRTPKRLNASCSTETGPSPLVQNMVATISERSTCTRLWARPRAAPVINCSRFAI